MDDGHVSTAPINEWEQSVDNLAGEMQEISLPVEPAPAPVPAATSAPAPEVDLLGLPNRVNDEQYECSRAAIGLVYKSSNDNICCAHTLLCKIS